MALNLVPQSPYFIPILRGLRPERALGCAQALFDAGMNCVEVPLNSPSPCKSIEILSNEFGDRFEIGAGTVLTVEQVFDVKQAGASLILTPNCNPNIIEACLACGLKCIPGFTTVTEAFQAIEAGARILKLFPAGQLGADYLKSIKAVIPDHIQILPVGGIDADNIAQWLNAGASGAGIGNWLFTPQTTELELTQKARVFLASAKQFVAHQENC